jgi:hypothetical protein
MSVHDNDENIADFHRHGFNYGKRKVYFLLKVFNKNSRQMTTLHLVLSGRAIQTRGQLVKKKHSDTALAGFPLPTCKMLLHALPQSSVATVFQGLKTQILLSETQIL